MAQPCGPAIADTYARARDPHETATDHATVRNLLDRLQAIINLADGAVVSSASVPVSPRLPVYGVSANGIGLPISVRDNNQRDLDPVPPESLFWINPYWWRDVGNQLFSWSLVGMDLMILRPSLFAATTVTVRHRAITAALNNDTDLFQCPDQDIRLVVMAAEALLLLKSRDLPAATIAWQNFIAEVKQLLGVVR